MRISGCFRAFALAASGLASPLAAQQPDPATSYLSRYRELTAMEPLGTQAAPVTNLVLHRDRADLVFEEGTIYLLSPVGGRYRGAVFVGKGTFRLAPSMPIEQERLKLFRKSTSVEEVFTEVVLLFADSTLAQLQGSLAFSNGTAPARARVRVREAIDYLGDKDALTLDPDVLQPFLNDVNTGLFYAHMARENSDPWMFLVNPQEVESVQFLSRARRTAFVRYAEVVTQFPARGDTIRTGGRLERRPEARIRKYDMDLRLPQTGTGELAFFAQAKLEIVADTVTGPWLAFWLFNKLSVDSARWDNGDPAEVFKARDGSVLWVRTDQRLAAGEARTLHLAYHGDLIDRFGDWFFIKSSIAWYPVSLDSRQAADFDLTILSPEGFMLASVGDRTDSAAAPGHMVKTRWVSPQPIRNASFTVGRYAQYEVRAEGIPPVTVLWSDDMHKAIGRGSSGKNMAQQVGDDVLNAMRFYQHVFGPAPLKHFYATEIPGYHGEAWPGIVGLSFITFHNSDNQGLDEVFRAHEVAHQWFGIGVDYATYRDRWLSEGFSNFAGLWYMQNRKGSVDKYFDLLGQWRITIMRRRSEPIPIWLGHRVATASTGDDYNTIVYEKGAWTLHMLRMLLLDLKTMNEDRFTNVMRDYYTSFQGKAASTEDFQAVVERGTGQKLDWFFNQWIRSSAIPTYRVATRIEEAEGKYRVKLRVTQEQVPEDFLMYVPVTVELENQQLARFRVKITGAKTELDLPLLPTRPRGVKFNDMEGVLAEVKNEGW